MSFSNNLLSVAPKLTTHICNIYGYTEVDREIYCDYLLRATCFEKGYVPTEKQIRKLQQEFDANLELFKLQAIFVAGHLEANDFKIELDHSQDIPFDRKFEDAVLKAAVKMERAI